MLHVYGWRRDGAGPFFLGSPRTVDDGITIAEDALRDRRRGFTRAEVRDVHGRRRDFPVSRAARRSGESCESSSRRCCSR
jgi:hypothetical protein